MKQGFLTILAVCALAGSGLAQRSVPASSPQVLQSVEDLRAELELIRERLGTPRPSTSVRAILNASSRETYWQARSLLLRTERLYFEQTRYAARSPVWSDRERPWAEVSKVVTAALHTLRRIREHLGIDPSAAPRSIPLQAAPKDAYAAIMECNDLLDEMLQESIGPAETYQQLNLALAYAMRLCLATPGHRIPRDPPARAGQSFAEAYATLLECLAVERAVGNNLGLNIADLDRSDPLAIRNADVFNLATLVLADLEGFYHECGASGEPFRTTPPGETTPAQVADRADLLKRYLLHLQTLELERHARHDNE